MYRRKDAYYARAKAAGYRSRAAYKLIELDDRFRLFRPGDRVVDLGAWPGSWLQVAAERVGKGGLVIGVDLEPINPLPPPIVCLVGDVREATTLAEIRERSCGPVDVVLSDMAPKLSGVRVTDEARARELAESALRAAQDLLRSGGVLLIKAFQGTEIARLQSRLEALFESVRKTRPEATRGGSAELYLVARGLRSARNTARREPA